MTEKEWLASEDTTKMLEWLHTEMEGAIVNCPQPVTVSDNQFRRLACATLYRNVGDAQHVRAVYDFADGKISWKECLEGWLSHFSPGFRPEYIAPADVHRWCRSLAEQDLYATLSMPASLLREVVGNPFQPVKIPEEVLTPLVLDLAQAAYDNSVNLAVLDADRLAILSDALLDAGLSEWVPCGGECSRYGYPGKIPIDRLALQWWDCFDCSGTGRWPHPLITHLRYPEGHVKGCWAIELIRSQQRK